MANSTEKPVMTVDEHGTKRWRLKNGNLHRTDGPAIEHAGGRKHWWLNGIYYKHKDWKLLANILNNFKKLGKINLDEATEQPVMTVDEDGNKFWKLKNGNPHRTDGPAVEYANGSNVWYINGKSHRTDGPAIEGVGGYKAWCINNKFHRTDGPAIEYAGGGRSWWVNGIEYNHKDWKAMVKILNNFKKLGKVNLDEATEKPVMTVNRAGDKIWHLNGKLHRTDGPAIESSDGTKRWYINNQRHRTDGPAVEYTFGSKEWWINNRRHRTDGPAVENANGSKQWWLNGIKYSYRDWKAMVNITNNLKGLGKVNLDESTKQPVMTVDEEGNKFWKLNGKPHRTDGAAIEYADGTKIWYINNQLHRTDGPAIEYADGSKEWWVNGNLHRTDGPAYEGASGMVKWYLNGIKYNHEDWKAMIDISKNFKKLSKLNLDESTKQPVMNVDKDGTKRWRLNGDLHRTDGAAVEYADGSGSWWVNGQRHRTDGPAVENASGSKEWYLNGIKYNHRDWKAMLNITNNFKKLGKINLDEATEQPVMTVDEEGNKFWKLNGKPHRTDGPAIEWVNGDKWWTLNGMRHRTDGPAVMYADGSKEWWMNGGLHRTDGPAYEGVNGDKAWWVNDNIHRTDGPAYEGVNGVKQWYLNGIKYNHENWKAMVNITNNFKKLGKINLDETTEQPIMTVDGDGNKWWTLKGELHRTDGPAIEGPNGTKQWWKNGKRHRTDGPAYEGANGGKLWYLNGINYSRDDWEIMVDIFSNLKKLGKVNLDEATEQPVMTVDKVGNKIWRLNGKYHRTDGPAIEYTNGNKSWYINGERHRTDGPAIEYIDGSKLWYINGERHRTDGPAIENANGGKEWYLNGKFHRTDRPAIEYADGYKKWYINGIEYNHKDWKAMANILNNLKKLGKINLDEATEQPIKN